MNGHRHVIVENTILVRILWLSQDIIMNKTSRFRMHWMISLCFQLLQDIILDIQVVWIYNIIIELNMVGLFILLWEMRWKTAPTSYVDHIHVVEQDCMWWIRCNGSRWTNAIVLVFGNAGVTIYKWSFTEAEFYFKLECFALNLGILSPS